MLYQMNKGNALVDEHDNALVDEHDNALADGQR